MKKNPVRQKTNESKFNQFLNPTIKDTELVTNTKNIFMNIVELVEENSVAKQNVVTPTEEGEGESDEEEGESDEEDGESDEEEGEPDETETPTTEPSEIYLVDLAVQNIKNGRTAFTEKDRDGIYTIIIYYKRKD